MVSGHVPPGDERCDVDWEGLAGSGLTLVIMMGVFHLPRITECLIEAGLDPQTPSAMVENAGLPQMRVLRSTVGEIAEIAKAEGVRPPAVTIIGEVAGLGA